MEVFYHSICQRVICGGSGTAGAKDRGQTGKQSGLELVPVVGRDDSWDAKTGNSSLGKNNSYSGGCDIKKLDSLRPVGELSTSHYMRQITVWLKQALLDTGC